MEESEANGKNYQFLISFGIRKIVHILVEREDVSHLLEAKDHDLMLAAELGKELLEKNEELRRTLEQANQENALKVEVLNYVIIQNLNV